MLGDAEDDGVPLAESEVVWLAEELHDGLCEDDCVEVALCVELSEAVPSWLVDGVEVMDELRESEPAADMVCVRLIVLVPVAVTELVREKERACVLDRLGDSDRVEAAEDDAEIEMLADCD